MPVTTHGNRAMPQPPEPASPESATAGETLTAGLTAGSRPAAPVPLPVPPPGRSFAPGDVAAGRYRIVRFLAQGGMGEVYEAEDLELRDPVALKTIAPHLAADPHVVERFKREILLARKVTHPNVCRLLELGAHRAGPGSKVLFLTMELLQGETLQQRLKRDGRLRPAEALPLVRQMCAALGAAHDVGVVHRDFKAANVMLVPAAAHPEPGPRLPSPVRVVVMDFGLARLNASEEDDTGSITQTGALVGTPAAMAPEQLKGEEATAATDVYALGLVLYEMLTGTRPFSGPLPGWIYKRLTEPAPSPRLLSPELDAAWEAAVLRCLEREPAHRFASAQQVVQALEGPMPAPSPIRPRRSVAVLGLKNLSGRPDSAWLSTALSEMLGTELAAREQLRIVPGESVARMKLELALPDADSYACATLGQIRQNLGADLVVVGSYVALGETAGGRLRLDLRLQDATAGETVALVHETGAEAEVFELVARAGLRLRGKLGLERPSATEAEQARAASPSSPEVLRLYSEGLAKLRVFEGSAACELLQRAVELAPRFPLVHSALSAAWHQLGYVEKAKQEAELAWQLAEGLPREEKLLVEGRYWAIRRQWDRAIEIYRALFTFFPDDVDHGLRLARALRQARQQEAARATLQALRALPPPASEDLRIELDELWTELVHWDDSRIEQRAAQIAAKAAAQGMRVLEAEAHKLRTRALLRLGELDKASAALEAATQIYAAVGNQKELTAARADLGSWHLRQGSVAEAARLFEQCLETARRIGWHFGEGWMLSSLANVAERRGDLAEARKLREQAKSIAEERIDPDTAQIEHWHLAPLLLKQGDLAGARAIWESLLTACRRNEDVPGVAGALDGLARLLHVEGRLTEAHRIFDEAQELARESGETRGQGQRCLCRARLLLDEGRWDEARELAREALEAFRVQKELDREGSAWLVLALLELRQGRREDAQQAIEQAEALSARTQHFGLQQAVAIVGARVRAASGRPEDAAEALGRLEQALAQLTKGGFYGLQLEARLALGELELAQRRPEARRRLEALQREAAGRGYGLIAAKAAAACRGTGSSAPS
jgi:eukaryotic-like serine/threonine-protein kinase